MWELTGLLYCHIFGLNTFVECHTELFGPTWGEIHVFLREMMGILHFHLIVENMVEVDFDVPMHGPSQSCSNLVFVIIETLQKTRRERRSIMYTYSDYGTYV